MNELSYKDKVSLVLADGVLYFHRVEIFDDNYFMKQALVEAQKAYDADEVPVGAVVAVSYTHLTLPTTPYV